MIKCSRCDRFVAMHGLCESCKAREPMTTQPVQPLTSEPDIECVWCGVSIPAVIGTCCSDEAPKCLRDKLDGAMDDLNTIKEEVARIREALKRADQFITNGIELGFIRMPTPESNDPALETPGIIKAALSPQKEPQV